MPIVDASDPEIWRHNWHGNKRGVKLQGYSRALCFEGACHPAKQILKALIPRGLTSGANILLVGSGCGFTAEWLARDWPNERVVSGIDITGLNVVCIDTSPLVQANKVKTDKQLRREYMLLEGKDPDGADKTELDAIDAVTDGGPQSRVEVYNYDLSTGKGRSDARKLIGNSTFDWGVTDNALPWLTDAEVQALTGRGLQVCDNVAHLVTPFLDRFIDVVEPEPAWNWRKLSEAVVSNGQTIQPWNVIEPRATYISLSTGEVV